MVLVAVVKLEVNIQKYFQSLKKISVPVPKTSRQKFLSSFRTLTLHLFLAVFLSLTAFLYILINITYYRNDVFFALTLVEEYLSPFWTRCSLVAIYATSPCVFFCYFFIILLLHLFIFKVKIQFSILKLQLSSLPKIREPKIFSADDQDMISLKLRSFVKQHVCLLKYVYLACTFDVLLNYLTDF